MKAKKKKAKRYNTPILNTHCESCDEKEMRFKLIKTLMTCKVTLHQFHNFQDGLKAQNALIATLPPVCERDDQLNQELVNVLQQRMDTETHSMKDVLPKCGDAIKTTWYERAQTPPEIFSITDQY